VGAHSGLYRSDGQISLIAAAAVVALELRQLADGRAGARISTAAAAQNDTTVWKTDGQYTMPKASGYELLDGLPAYWDHSAGVATWRKVNDRDYFLGTVVGDVANATLTCLIDLNVQPVWEIDLRQGLWTSEATDGLGVTSLFGGGVKLAFDAVAEVAQAALYSERTLPIASNPIMMVRFAVVDNGDNAALDIDIGLAIGSHATDFEAITEFVAFHLDGDTLDLDAHSDDGTTDVAPTDTTVNLVEGTYVEVWIDARVPTAIKLYVDGVRVLSGTTFTLGAATGPVKAILHMEKTSDDTPAELRVVELKVKTSEQ